MLGEFLCLKFTNIRKYSIIILVTNERGSMNMKNVQSPLIDALRYNYAQTIEKMKREYEKRFGPVTEEVYKSMQVNAYNKNRDMLKRCLIFEPVNPDDSMFTSFTREGNSRSYIMNLTNGDPQIFRERLLKEFIAIEPKTEKAAILRNALEVTMDKFSPEQATTAIKEVIINNEYNRFSRRRNEQGPEINYREDLKQNIGPDDFADIILSTALSPQRERIQDKITGLIERVKKNIEQKHPEVKNVQVNPNLVRMAKVKATDPNWHMTRHTDVSLGNGLYASSDIGNVRQNQEDSVLILYHPQNPGFKMLVVSDGMGGMSNGEVASSFVVDKIAEWFNSLPAQAFNRRNVEALRMQYEEAIKQIDRKLNKDVMQDRGGATFCGAIVTEKETIISNVGDSRAYAYSKGRLQQITKDDGVAYQVYEAGLIEKDDIRFHPHSNIINQAMGLDEPVQPRSTVIPNSSYECLMLVSDGISDCLSDMQIKAITQATPRDKLAQMLIQEAKARDSVSKDGSRRIRAGKDNATVAIYDKDK